MVDNPLGTDGFRFDPQPPMAAWTEAADSPEDLVIGKLWGGSGHRGRHLARSNANTSPDGVISPETALKSTGFHGNENILTL